MSGIGNPPVKPSSPAAVMHNTDRMQGHTRGGGGGGVSQRGTTTIDAVYDPQG